MPPNTDPADSESPAESPPAPVPGPALLRVATFLFEYQRNKFRISLPSRRPSHAPIPKLSADALPILSHFPDWSTRSDASSGPSSSKSVFGKYSPASSLAQLAANYEFAYMEDILGRVSNLLAINTKPVQLSGPVELACMANFRCMIYHSDMLYFNLFIRYDGQVIDTTESLPSSSPGFSSPYGITRALADPHHVKGVYLRSKVYDQSSVHLFKETFNLGAHLRVAISATVSDDDETDTEASVRLDRPEERQLMIRDMAMLDESPNTRLLGDTSPDLDSYPHTKSAFSLSSDASTSEEDQEEDDGQSSDPSSGSSTAASSSGSSSDAKSGASVKTDPEFDDFEGDDWTGEYLPPGLSSGEDEDDELLLLEQAPAKKRRSRARLASSKSISRSYDRSSMSTIYSEESFQVNADFEDTFTRRASLVGEISSSSESDADESDFEVVDSLSPQAVASSSSPDASICKRKFPEDDESHDRRSLCSSKSVHSCVSAQEFEDPYENPESLQAAERCLDEKDIVYSQTVEIISDDEGEDGRRQGELSGSKVNDLASLLESLPLSNLQATIAWMNEHLLLKKSDIRARQELVSRMEAVLKAHGFNCQLYIFGSTKNCLGLRTSSDIDIFIQMRDSANLIIDESHLSYGKIEHVLHRIDRILGDDQAYLDVLTGQTTGGRADITIHTICHRHMRVPITRIKVFLSSIQLPGSSATLNDPSPDRVIQCDLNVNNALGIANTRLLRFFCKFESRFLILNVLLRYWSKYEANLNKADALSSYALSNLIIFFFQMRRPALLPSIDYFVRLSESPKIINDWRCDFCKDPAKIDFKTKNKETVMQLFLGFFTFYKTFNFLQFKISTRFARAWRLRMNRGRRQMSGRLQGGPRGGAAPSTTTAGGGGSRDRAPYVHIMDPFEQNHNLTARMHPKMFDKMCLEFSQALEKYRKYA